MTKRQFPDAEERTRIIARRSQLHRDLLEYLVRHSPDEQQAREQLNPLAREYGFDELYRMLQKISPMLHRPKDPDAEDVYLYNQYVETYRRFGGDRPFLSLPEYHRLNQERAMLLAKPMLKAQQLSLDEQRRVDELSDTLLSESYLWDDLVPENPSKVPVQEQGTPAGKKVGRNDPCPCGSGRKYKHCHGR